MWYPGTITRVHPDDTFDVSFDDGDREEHVMRKYMKPMAIASSPKQAKKEEVEPSPTPPPPDRPALSAYEMQRLDNIAANHSKLADLGIADAVAACKTEKKAPKKRQRAESVAPSRGSRRLKGEAAVDVYVEDDEGRQLTLGGDAEEVAMLSAEQRAVKDAQRAEAWEAARTRAAASSASPTGPVSEANGPPGRHEFVDLATPLFHLNSFIDSEAKVNRAFGLFLSEGFATPGFRRASDQTLERVQGQWPLDEAFRPALREMLVDDYKTTGRDNPSAAGQRATWLTACRPGAYIVCRHAYEACPHMPAALRGADGAYLGAVYAVGRVVAFPPPQSAADDAIVAHLPKERLARLDMERYYLHANAQVEWFALGYLDELRPQTAGYINQVCQPTLNQMLKGGGRNREYHAACRRDLWDKAKIKINADMFSC